MNHRNQLLVIWAALKLRHKWAQLKKQAVESITVAEPLDISCPELGLCYAESRYDKFPLFQQLKFDIALLSVTLAQDLPPGEDHDKYIAALMTDEMKKSPAWKWSVQILMYDVNFFIFKAPRHFLLISGLEGSKWKFDASRLRGDGGLELVNLGHFRDFLWKW